MIGSIAFRYFISKKSTNAINIIAWVSIAAIAVGAAALIVVLSVFNGFEGLVKSLYSTFYPEIKITPARGKTFVISPQQWNQLQHLAGVSHLSRVVEEKAILRFGDEQAIAVLKGVDSDYTQVVSVNRKLIRGHFELGDEVHPRAVLGAGIENALDVDVVRSLFPITTYVPKRGIHSYLNPEQALNTGYLQPSGTFAIQQDFDNKYVLTNIAFMRQLLQLLPDRVSAIEIKTSQLRQLAAVKQQIWQMMGQEVVVQTRYEQNKALYNIMRTEKWAVYMILSFILIIAAFNMVGSLSMLVIEKQKDITILKAMGASNALIRKIFLAEGLLLAGVGTIIGAAIAVCICWVQQRFGLIKLQGGTFVVNDYPVDMQVGDFLLVIGTILFIALLAAWVPAKRASLQVIDLKS